ncbi:Stp1/IreP family PP2C-type Ser/Thr phosphatase [Candidatus Magnetominusculus xianensis]|uniref:Serine/threonine phosphatase n=1 Tax=Candidatus Magnetominusculus xianensis TaxID=1748249 RepID=A0ABR5SGV1_9BACT|nr:Stp1/IreP family PP2C-type Ser/Thr phosphatase [Candidatus Magnetominusculus xianensis]KWT90924.1 serine/threonine phosphatase [Candidatus Magnetominusculus xianensis]MBF0403079.1 Stp1/IreP family PP2C-type Ser/Thr phosphatase [Nitrospirota bacterium]
MNKAIISAGLSDKGHVRKRNEDSLMLDNEYGLYIVSDGMGGHAAGDMASKMVVEILPTLLQRNLRNIKSLQSPQVEEGLTLAFTELNDQVRMQSKSKAGMSGMGATVVLAMFKDDLALIAHMGDSRAYLLRSGSFAQLTIDHSVVQVLIDSGEITSAQAVKHPARGKITRCIGMTGEVMPDIRVAKTFPGDRYLLCSDGLTGMVDDDTIVKILNKHKNIETACIELVAAANSAGGVDNITVVLVECAPSQSKGRSGEYDFASMETEEFAGGTITAHDSDRTEPYAFVVDLDKQPSHFCMPVKYPSFSIGRSTDNDLALKWDKTISRKHCVIKVAGDSLVIEDTNSRNGTYLNGHRFKGTQPLPVPSWIALGRTRIGIIPSASGTQPEGLTEGLFDEAYASEGSILIPPSEFFEERTEALLVVDIVGSTRIVKQGDTHLVKVISALGQMLDKVLQSEKHPFLKCTGDGFFATFGTADSAISAALKLSPGVQRYIKIPVQISVALHWGPVRLTQEGERTGRNAHAVFSVEDLRHKEEKVNSFLVNSNRRELILMTESFWQTLSPDLKVKAMPIGSYHLKGLEETEAIYYWYAPVSDKSM